MVNICKIPPDEEPRQPLQLLGHADAEVWRDQAGRVAGHEAGKDLPPG
jgi:hypothetical protein